MPLVYDFQYCGKACVAKDLAYFFNVDVMAGAAEEEARPCYLVITPTLAPQRRRRCSHT